MAATGLRPSTRGAVALLFSDVEGSTRLLQQLGPAYADVLLRHRALMRSAFAEHDGTEHGTEGDSFFVTFPTASDAVGAALAAQQRLHREPWPVGASVRVRIGVHVGGVERVADDLIGLAIHEAARIAAAAHGGQVLASEAAAQLAESGPEGAGWLDLGHHNLKDITEPVHLLQLTHVDLPLNFPPPRTHGHVRHNLPAQPSSFVGRTHEVEEVVALLAAHRLVTVTGAGGAGKTRIALRVGAEVMARYTGGAWFVDLAAINDPARVPAQIVEALGLPPMSLSELAEEISERHVLLLVDNCEHLIAAASEALVTLAQRCSELSVLCTSREPLGVPGEIVWRIPPLDDDDAIRLLTERARAVNPHFELDDNSTEAARLVVDRLDAIPLALELAAARLATLSVGQLASRLDQRFRLLAGGVRGVAERHRTLQATVDWSYDLLEPDDRLLLHRVGVFAGGFTLDAAESISGDDPQAVLDRLDRLVQKSLVVATHRAQRGVRYRLLETVRQYALDRLMAAGDLVAARDAHMTWLADLARRAEAVLWLGGDEAGWMARLDDEDANIRAAFEWALDRGDFASATGMLVGTFGWTTGRGHSIEGLQWAQRLLARDDLGDVDRAVVSVLEMAYASNCGRLDAAMVERAEQAGPRLRQWRLPWMSPLASAYAAAWSYAPGDRDGASRAIGVCEACFDEVRDAGPGLRGWLLQPLVWVNLDAGNIDAAAARADEGLRAASEAGLSIMESRMAINRARIAITTGDYERAWTMSERAVKTARATGETFVLSAAIQLLADVAEARGDTALARDLLASILDAVAESQTTEAVAAVRARLDALAPA